MNRPHTIIHHDAKESGQLLRKELKLRFPGTKFSVRMSRGTGYGYYSVRWTDGPSSEKVNPVVDHFQGQDFDGMDDSMTIRKGVREGTVLHRYGTRLINCHRDLTPEAWKAIEALPDYFENIRYRIASECSFTPSGELDR